MYADVDAMGGAEIALGNLIAGGGGGYEVHVAGTHEPLVRWLAERGNCPYHVTGPGPLAHLRLLRRVRPGLVQVNLEVPWAAATMLSVAFAWPGLRVVGVEHMSARTVDLGLLLRTRALALRLDGHVAVSANAARRVEDFYALGRGSVRVIYNGVPTDLAYARTARPRPDDRLVVGAVGRLDPVKGHDILIKALAWLPGMRVVILGSGPRQPELRRLAREVGVADRVSLPGWCDRVEDWLGRFDLFCHPSRYEGLGLALIEAMRAGLPIVATSVGGVPELLDGGRCGLLVPPEDPPALAAAITGLAADPVRREFLGERARDRVHAEFSVDRMVAAYERLWAETLAAPRGSRLRVRPPEP